MSRIHLILIKIIKVYVHHVILLLSHWILLLAEQTPAELSKHLFWAHEEEQLLFTDEAHKEEHVLPDGMLGFIQDLLQSDSVVLLVPVYWKFFKMKKNEIERRIINSFIQQITGDENFIYLKN